MRTSYKNAALSLTASIALAAPFRHAHAARTLVDRVVAVIDTEIITEQELMTQAKGPLSELPVNAQGAEALFDLFAALPGFPTEAMLQALNRTEGPVVTLWRAPNVVVLPPTVGADLRRRIRVEGPDPRPARAGPTRPAGARPGPGGPMT